VQADVGCEGGLWWSLLPLCLMTSVVYFCLLCVRVRPRATRPLPVTPCPKMRSRDWLKLKQQGGDRNYGSAYEATNVKPGTFSLLMVTS